MLLTIGDGLVAGTCAHSSLSAAIIVSRVTTSESALNRPLNSSETTRPLALRSHADNPNDTGYPASFCR